MPRPPKNKALAIGISTYPAGINNLPAVARDVREVAKLLSSKNGRFPKDAVATLTNRNAKKEAVTCALRDTFRASPNATVFAYLAGHGAVFDGKYYFVTYDTKPAELATTALPLEDIRTLFDGTKSTKAFLWLDFCHSGGILARMPTSQATTNTQIFKRTLNVIQGQGNVIIAACTENQLAYEDSSHHGHFTGALLKGLRGGATSNGEVTVTSLYDFIDREIGSSVQRPMLFGKMTGRIVLMHYDGAAKSPSSQPAIKKPNSKAKPKSKKTSSATRSSGKWTLLGDNLFFEAAKVRQNPEGTLLLDVRSSNPTLDAAIKDLSPTQFRSREALNFAHQNDAAQVYVKNVSSESTGQGKLWQLTLEPANPNHGYNPMSEMSFDSGNRHYSAHDIATLRARKLLLDEEIAERNVMGFDFLSPMGHDLTQAECPIRDIFQLHSKRKAVWPKLARLKAIALLKKFGIVEHVLDLSIHPRERTIARIRFKGRRPSPYANESPHVISFNGDCRLT